MNSLGLDLDALYCEEEEERWELEDPDEEAAAQPQTEHPKGALFLESENNRGSPSEEQDGEIAALLAKERLQKDETTCNNGIGSGDQCLGPDRGEGVELILKVNAHHGFSALTAVLAVNYFDRFFALIPHFPSGRPSWIVHLAAVTCLSLAAKLEETHVPLLLDLQLEETIYLFEAKTIQRMELLILSTLKWRMNPVTPISFLDHIMGRLGLKNRLHWEFLRRCECLLLSVAADPNFVRYLPSVVATATMMRVIEELVGPSDGMVEYQNRLLCVLKISKEAVYECYQLIIFAEPSRGQKKRQRCNNAPDSPIGVIDACLLCDGTWPLGWWSTFSAVAAVPEPLPKRFRAREQDVPLLSSLDRVFVGTD